MSVKLLQHENFPNIPILFDGSDEARSVPERMSASEAEE